METLNLSATKKEKEIKKKWRGDSFLQVSNAAEELFVQVN